jgi:O-antigen/teichoic acid export membrane protein
MAAGQVGFGAAGMGAIGLPLGDVAGRTAATLMLGRGFHRHRSISLAGIRSAAARYRRFPIFTAPAQLLTAAGRQLPPVLIAAFYGPVAAGFFALSDRVGGGPAQFAGEALGQTFVSEVGPLVERDPARIEGIFLRLAARLSALALVAISPLLAGPWLFETVFGAQWRTAGEFTRILAILFAARFVVIPLGQVLPLLGYQHWHLMWAVGRAIVTLGAIALAGAADYSVNTAILLYSVTANVFYVILFVASLIGIRRFARRARVGGAG